MDISVSDFMKRRYDLTIYVALTNHFALGISSDGQELMKPFKFTNDNAGIQLLTSHLVELSYVDDSIIIGLESTGNDTWRNR